MDMAAQKKTICTQLLLCWIADPYNQIFFRVTVMLEFVCLIYIQCWKLISISVLYMVLSISRYGVGAKS